LPNLTGAMEENLRKSRLQHAQELLHREPGESVPQFESIIAEARAAGDHESLAHGCFFLGYAHLLLQAYGPAKQPLEEAAILAKDTGLLSILAHTKFFLGVIERHSRNDRTALTYWTEVLRENSGETNAGPFLDEIGPEVERLAISLSADPEAYPTWFHAIMALAEDHTNRGRPGEAVRLVEWSETQSLREQERAEANAVAGIAELIQGRAQQAKQRFLQAIDSVEKAGNPQAPPVYMLQNFGKAQKLCGEYPEAIATLHQVETTLKNESPAQESHANLRAGNLIEIGAVHREMGATRPARTYLKAAQAVADSLPAEDPSAQIMRAFVLTNLGLVESDDGEFASATEHQKQALALLQNQKFSYPVGEAQILENLALALYGIGEHEPAKAALRSSLETYRKTGNTARQNAILLLLGDASLQSEDWAAALVQYQEALSIARGSANPYGEAMAAFGISSAYWQQGDHQASASAFAASIDLWKLLQAQDKLALAYSRRANLVAGEVAPEEEIALRKIAEEAWRAAGEEAAASSEFLRAYRVAVTAKRIDALTDPLAALNQAATIPELRWDALFAKSTYLERNHDLPAALKVIQQVVNLSEEQPGEDAARPNFVKARILQALNQPAESTQAMGQGVAHIDQLPSDRERAEFWYWAGEWYAHRPEQIADAIDCFFHARECFQRSGDLRNSYECRRQLARLYMKGENPQEAMVHLWEAAQYSREYCEAGEVLEVEQDLGIALLNAEMLADAASQLQYARTLAEELKQPADVLMTDMALLDVLLRQKKWPEAEASLRYAKQWANARSDVGARVAMQDQIELGSALLHLRRGKQLSPRDWQKLLQCERMRSRSEKLKAILASPDVAQKTDDLADLLRGALFNLKEQPETSSGGASGMLFNSLQLKIWEQNVSRHLGWKTRLTPRSVPASTRTPSAHVAADESGSDLQAVEDLITDYSALGVWEDPSLAIFKPPIDRATWGGRFAGRVLINPPSLTPGCLHFYFYRSDPQGRLSAFLDTCAYLSSGDVILCSLPFLEQLMTYVAMGQKMMRAAAASIIENEGGKEDSDPGGFISDETLEQIHRMIHAGFGQFLIEWVITHEVGHAELGHHSTFRNAGPVASADERAADDFYAGKVLNMGHATEAMLSLANVLLEVYRDCYESEYGVSYAGEEMVTLGATLHLPPDTGPHAHFLIRLLDLADRILRRYPNVDSSGYYDKVRRNIVRAGGAL
jgi:hypothetical protein